MHARRSRRRRRRITAVIFTLVAVACLAFMLTGMAGAGPTPKPEFSPLQAWPKPSTFAAPNVKAQAVALFVNGSLVYQIHGQTPRPTASTAKMMTAYTILTHPKLGLLSRTFTITPSQVRATWQAIRQNDQELIVKAGEKYTGKDLLYAAMLPSDNNAAHMLASAVPGGLPAFVKLMNDTAKHLGLSHAHYVDPSGLSSGDQVSAIDTARLAMAGLNLPAFAQVVATHNYTLSTGHKVKNLNRLLFSYPGAIGVKTGWTVPAGRCLAFAARRQMAGKPITVVGVVMGEPTWTRLYSDVTSLLDAGFATVHSFTISKGTPVGQVAWGQKVKTTLVAEHTVTFPVVAPVHLTRVKVTSTGDATAELSSGPLHYSLALKGPPPPAWYRWALRLPGPLSNFMRWARL